MKSLKGILTSLIVPLLTLLSGGCIHTYPHGEAQDPTRISLSLSLSLEDYVADRPLPAATYRFLTTVRNNSRILASQESFVDIDSPEKEIYLKINTPLPPVRYDVCVWGEIVDPLTRLPLHYDASDLSHIRILPFWESKFTTSAQLTPPCALRGETTFDPRSLPSSGKSEINLLVNLTNPAGMIAVVTTDAAPFIDKFPAVQSTPGAFSISLEFTTPTAEALNLLAGEPAGYVEWRAINAPIILPDPSASTLLEVPLFALSEGEQLTADIVVYNSARSIISRTRDVTFSIHPSRTSILRGAFLSNYFENPLKVDNEWEGEIIIDN